MDEGYNGYKNYETWNICLWVDNEEPIYRDRIRRLRYDKFTPESAEEFCREWFPNGTPDFDSVEDYSLVDWQEVADIFNED